MNIRERKATFHFWKIFPYLDKKSPQNRRKSVKSPQNRRKNLGEFRQYLIIYYRYVTVSSIGLRLL